MLKSKFLFLVFLLVVCPTLLLAKNKTIRGYVSSVNSPTEFELDDLRVICDPARTKVIETHLATELQHDYEPKYIHLGLEVEVSGDLSGDDLTATKVEIFTRKEKEEISGVAMIERSPDLQEKDGKILGTVYADGRVLRVTEASVLEFRDAAADKKSAKPVALTSATQIKPNVVFAYSGKRRPDGSIAVAHARVVPNYVDVAESKMRLESEFQFEPGVVKLKRVGELRIVADEGVQKRVQEIGDSVIPQYQKQLPDTDLTKYHFRFLVVEYKGPQLLVGSNGTVLVPLKVITRLQNEAQLAAVLAMGVAQITQKYEYRTRHERNAVTAASWSSLGLLAVPVPGLALAANLTARAAYKQYLTDELEQVARVSLDQLYAAGWDVREAPTAMRLLYAKHHGEPGNDTSMPFTGLMLNEIRYSYADVDFTKLRKDERPYSELALAAAAKSKS